MDLPARLFDLARPGIAPSLLLPSVSAAANWPTARVQQNGCLGSS